MSSPRLSTSVICCLVLGACTDDSLGPTQFIDDYLETYCNYLMRCCDVAERSYTTQIACETDRRPYLEAMLAFRDAESPAASFVSSEAQSCIDKLGQRDCVLATKAKDCLYSVTQGRHDAGDACTHSAECRSYYCIQPQKNAAGYCAASSDGSCSGDDRACTGGSYCDQGALQCVTRREAGQLCDRPEQCISGICTPQKVCAAASTPLCDGI